MRGLKYFEFSSKLKKQGEDIFGIDKKIDGEEGVKDKKVEEKPRKVKGPPEKKSSGKKKHK